MEPWLVWEADFPRGADVLTQLRFVLKYAILAHSPYNTQPWIFEISPQEIVIRADRSRQLAVLDPSGRLLTMSCGAALYHLRLALHNFNFSAQVTILPNAADPDELARVRIGPSVTTNPDERLLFVSMPWTRLNPHSFEARDLPETLPLRLQSAARASGAWLNLANSDKRRKAVAELVREGGHQQWSSEAFRSEFAQWLRSGKGVVSDGMPAYSLHIRSATASLARRMLRHLNLRLLGADYGLALHAPALVVLGTTEDSPAAWMAAGQCLARVLLLARSVNVSAWTFDEVVEVPQLREKLLPVFEGRGYPQALLRLGYGRSVRPSPRRDVDAVVKETAAAMASCV